MGTDENFHKELQAAVKSCGTDDNGMVPIKSLKLIMRSLGFEPRNDEIRQLTIQLMQNTVKREEHPDSISVDELMDLLREKFDERSGLNEMRTAFELFDNTSKGYISVDDLQRVARELGEEIDDEQLKEMIVEADSEGFGKVSEADFFTVMKKTALY